MANPRLKSAAQAVGACLLSAVLLRLSYPVPGWYPLAWVALVPWLIVVRDGSGRAAIGGSALMGLVGAGLCLSWQYIVNFWAGLGLTIYVGAYFVLFAWLVRAATRRLRVPWMIAAPVIWTGCEFFRGFFITGLPWLFLGHTQQPFLGLIQVCDLFGVPVLSFLVMAANAFVAEVALMALRRQMAWRRVAAGALFVAALVGGTLGYGHWRLGHVPGREGPLVGIVQANVPQEVKNTRDIEEMAQIILDHIETTKRLRALPGGRRLDLIVWPESMVQFPLNRRDYESMAELWRRFVELARLMGCPILIGAHAEIGDDLEIEAAADGTVESVTEGTIVVDGRRYDVPQQTDRETGETSHRYILVRVGERVRAGQVIAMADSLVHNSAYLVRPDGSVRPGDRYDKNHLVPFGEYVPLGLLLWFVRQAVPFHKGFSPGARLDVMTLGDTRFGVLICFEGIFPGIVRDYVSRPPGEAAEFLVNISNDGWFEGSPELDQHLAITAFRAVEFRTGIVRCVNSGISAIIDPDGRIHSAVADAEGRRKLVEGVSIGRVRLREGLTFYARHGDLFGIACTLLTALPFLAILLPAIARRLRRRKCADGACPVRP